MANDRVRPLGFNDLTTLLGSEVTALDLNVSRAPNEVTGSNGVVAAPATALLWGGAGVTVSGQFTASGTSTISGPSTMGASGSLAITLDAGASVTLNPVRTFTRAVPGLKWLNGTSTVHGTRLPIPTGATLAITPLLNVPNGATITSIVVQVDPAVNDGVLPGTPAVLSLGYRPVSGSGSAITTNLGGFTSDSNASDAEHSIAHTLAPAQQLDLSTREYYICVVGEDGANAQVLEWLTAKVTYTLGAIPWG